MIKTQKIKSVPSADRYFEAAGRRKTSVARVRLFTNGKPGIIVNGKEHLLYFPSWDCSIFSKWSPG